jgi:pSer/pThr/pTyr-binding forkhead associated (FHA) protein
MILVIPSGQQYHLRVGENVIGRGSECDLRLSSEQVSRRHASIRWDGQQARVTDLGSTNGTRLNDRRLEPQQSYPLNPTDRLELGGADGRLEVRASTGVYAEPLVEPYVEPSRPAAGRVPAWLYAIVGVAAVLLIAAIVLLVTMNRPEETTTSVQPTATPTAEGLAAVVTPLAGTVQALLPSVTPLVSVPKVETGKGAGGTGGAAAPQPQAPAAALPAGQIPPINPTSMPELVNSLVKEFVPGEVLQPLSTVVSGLPGGTALPKLPGQGQTPALPAGPKRYPAPVLRGPADGSSFRGDNDQPILEWEPMNNLAANDYYRVIVFYKKDGRELAGGTWMKATSYRVPLWFLRQQEGRFEWQVVIAEATGLPEKNGKLGATVSDPSPRRWFTWAGGGGGGPGPVPTPTPKDQG